MVSDQAFALSRAGHSVIVIASRQDYQNSATPLPAFETIDGVDIYRVTTSSFGRFRLLGRAIDYVTFYWGASWRLLRLARRDDIVVAKTDPPLLSVVAYIICKFKRARLINWLQDIFPEVAERLGVGGWLGRYLIYPFLRLLRNRSLKGADCNVVLGDRMAQYLGELGVSSNRVSIIPNWADGRLLREVPLDQNELRQDWGLTGNFVVCHSGNLGRAHDYQTILGAIERLEADAPRRVAQRGMTWLFVGGGWNFARLQKEVEARGLTSVQFRPYQARENLSESLSVADVHLVSLAPELEGLIVPSKIYGAMAVARPLIFIGDLDGEVARLATAHDVGKVIKVGDSDSLAQTVLDLALAPQQLEALGKNAAKLFEEHYDVRHAQQKWCDLINSLGASN